MRKRRFGAPALALLVGVAACSSEQPADPTPVEEEANTVLTDAVNKPLDAAAEAEALIDNRKSRLDDALAEQEGNGEDESDPDQ
ncbi:MAG: hypothetical protein AAAFM81_02080 [Pseudomonadota bacterium]